MAGKRKVAYKRVCYGIQKPDGELWMSESCICEDKSTLLIEELKSAPEGSKVVPLFVRKRGA
jgi:hypothetical protein